MKESLKRITIPENHKLHYFNALYSRLIHRWLFYNALTIIVAFLMLIYCIAKSIINKNILYNYFIIVDVILILGLLYFFILLHNYHQKKHKEHPYIVQVSFIISTFIMLCGSILSLIHNHPLILITSIFIVTFVIPATPTSSFIQFISIQILYIFFNFTSLNFNLENILTVTVVCIGSNVISIILYLYRYREFLYLKELNDQNKLLEEKNKILRYYSYYDSLTGIKNRRRIDDILKSAWNYCKKENTNLSIILFDIDNFKKYNDHYGHLQGDHCLKTISSEIQKMCEHFSNYHQCTFGRYGGEEFIIVLPNENKRLAMMIGEEVKNKIANLKIPHEGTNPTSHITISCGVTTMIPSDEIRIFYILETADQALYYAKANGKNQICHFSEINK